MMSLDDLFREAFQPIAEATPPEDSWRRIVRSLDHEVGAPLFGRANKVLDWIQGFQNAYRGTSDVFVCAQPYRCCSPYTWGLAIAQ
ncbi:MAG: hypothetical protein ACP5JG_09715 [Anaerolineae bacterium]